MNHGDGWMSGGWMNSGWMSSGGMWVLTIVGIVIIAALIVVVSSRFKK